MIKKTIFTQKTARYFHNKTNLSDAENIIFALHGYAYLAQKFLKKLQFLFSKNNLIVCPEGLSKFYIKGFDGQVGASWMTKENREEEINDYCIYLDKV